MVDAEDTRKFVITFASRCIYECVMQIAKYTSEGNGLPQEQLLKMKQELREFIQADVGREFSDIDITKFDWSSPKNKQVVAQLYKHAHEIWEALYLKC